MKPIGVPALADQTSNEKLTLSQSIGRLSDGTRVIAVLVLIGLGFGAYQVGVTVGERPVAQLKAEARIMQKQTGDLETKLAAAAEETEARLAAAAQELETKLTEAAEGRAAVESDLALAMLANGYLDAAMRYYGALRALDGATSEQERSAARLDAEAQWAAVAGAIQEVRSRFESDPEGGVVVDEAGRTVQFGANPPYPLLAKVGDAEQASVRAVPASGAEAASGERQPKSVVDGWIDYICAPERAYLCSWMW